MASPVNPSPIRVNITSAAEKALRENNYKGMYARQVDGVWKIDIEAGVKLTVGALKLARSANVVYGEDILKNGVLAEAIKNLRESRREGVIEKKTSIMDVPEFKVSESPEANFKNLVDILDEIPHADRPKFLQNVILSWFENREHFR